MAILFSAKGRQKSFDWITISLFFSILFIGWLALYATEYTDGTHLLDMNLRSTIGKQTIWIGLAIVAFIISISLDWKLWGSFSFILYGISVLSLILLFVFGNEVKGATSWFAAFGLSVQPSEFAKLSTCLALATYLSSSNTKLNNRPQIYTALAIFLVPSFLIALQPDAGSAIIFLSFFVVLYRAGFAPIYYLIGIALASNFIGSLLFGPQVMMIVISLIMISLLSLSLRNKKWFIGPLAVYALSVFILYDQVNYSYILLGSMLFVLLVGALSWVEQNSNSVMIIFLTGILSIAISFGTDWGFNNILKAHQQERINVWLHPEKSDPQGSLYNILQSKTAIGSGGMTGQGFLKGPMTKLNYVPEQETDFIFSTIGEEQGFLGVFGLIALYTILIFRVTVMAERAVNNFVRYYAYGVAGLLFVHYFVNIGMTLGIMPVIGIPLIFVSKGGSAVLSFSIMIGILLKMDRDKIS